MRFHLFVLALVPSTLVAALAPAQVAAMKERALDSATVADVAPDLPDGSHLPGWKRNGAGRPSVGEQALDFNVSHTPGWDWKRDIKVLASDYNIQDTSTLHLVLRMRGGGYTPAIWGCAPVARSNRLHLDVDSPRLHSHRLARHVGAHVRHRPRAHADRTVNLRREQPPLVRPLL